MDRYFFNVYNHVREIDEEGHEFASPTQARAAAVVFAGDYLSDNPHKLDIGETFVVEVRDGRGAVVVTIQVSACEGAAAASGTR